MTAPNPDASVFEGQGAHPGFARELTVLGSGERHFPLRHAVFTTQSSHSYRGGDTERTTMNWPGKQPEKPGVGVHCDDPAVEAVPVGHSLHELLALKKPGGQGLLMQPVLAEFDMNDGGQDRQCRRWRFNSL